jgi:hypothetical protein
MMCVPPTSILPRKRGRKSLVMRRKARLSFPCAAGEGGDGGNRFGASVAPHVATVTIGAQRNSPSLALRGNVGIGAEKLATLNALLRAL